MKLYFSENKEPIQKSEYLKKMIKGCNKIVCKNKKVDNYRKKKGLAPLDRSINY